MIPLPPFSLPSLPGGGSILPVLFERIGGDEWHSFSRGIIEVWTSLTYYYHYSKVECTSMKGYKNSYSVEGQN
jgi:hypothetical protein